MKKRGTGYSRHTVGIIIRIALLTFCFHLLVILVASYYSLTVNPVSYWWCLVWLEAAVFSWINTGEAVGDWKAARQYVIIVRDERPLVPAAGWFLRIDALALAVSGLMTLAGYSSIFRVETKTVVLFLLFAGIIFSVSQAWSRADRMRLNRIIREDREHDANSAREEIEGGGQ